MVIARYSIWKSLRWAAFSLAFIAAMLYGVTYSGIRWQGKEPIGPTERYIWQVVLLGSGILCLAWAVRLAWVLLCDDGRCVWLDGDALIIETGFRRKKIARQDIVDVYPGAQMANYVKGPIYWFRTVIVKKRAGRAAEFRTALFSEPRRVILPRLRQALGLAPLPPVIDAVKPRGLAFKIGVDLLVGAALLFVVAVATERIAGFLSIASLAAGLCVVMLFMGGAMTNWGLPTEPPRD